jgi:hypothetical protein
MASRKAAKTQRKKATENTEKNKYSMLEKLLSFPRRRESSGKHVTAHPDYCLR